MKRKRNAPLSASQVAALRSVLASHGYSNPGTKRRAKAKRKSATRPSRKKGWSGKRVVRRTSKARTMRPHVLFVPEWSMIQKFRKAHAERKKKAATALSGGAVAESVADRILGSHYKMKNPPPTVRRWVTDAEWRLVKAGRKKAALQSPNTSSMSDEDKDEWMASVHGNPVPFRTRRGKLVRFKVRRRRKGKVPSHLRKYTFKPGSARLASALRKARAGYRRWKAAKAKKARKTARKTTRKTKARRGGRRSRR